jgi:FKBP-type peptidyl-prolyl cis-trans isomerase
MATKKSQRIAIWIIAIVMAVGTLGAYFVVILDNNNTQRDQERLQKQYQESLKKQQESQQVDPTAYKVEGPVTELKKEDLTVGTGPAVKAGDTIRVQYKGTIAQTGVKFDSSYDRGEPATFALKEASGSESGVIKGWVQGIEGMQVGGKRRLIIPASLAYGAEGSGTIPANADLVFEVELQAINPPQ